MVNTYMFSGWYKQSKIWLFNNGTIRKIVKFCFVCLYQGLDFVILNLIFGGGGGGGGGVEKEMTIKIESHFGCGTKKMLKTTQPNKQRKN